MTTLEVLQRSALFKDFSEAGVRTFAEIAHAKAVPAGSPLFVENMVGESLLIVKSGTVRITQRAGEGERELATLGAGEHLGELALLGKTVRLVSAVAATQCEVLEITQRDFVRLQPQKPQACLKLALAIAGALAGKLAENGEALLELVTRKPGA